MKQIELKDYLHYYIGAECIDSYSSEKATITGCLINNEQPAIISINTVNQNRKLYEIKPILRRLSDIKKDELMEVCKIAMPLPFMSPNFKCKNFCVSKVGPEKFSGMECSITGNAYSYFFDVSDGSIITYIDDDFSPTLDVQLIFHYLLTRHFDLFGLIDGGLAIDKASLK